LEAALLWALEKPPERRPATAGELAAALRDALELSPTIGAYTDDGRRSLPAWPASPRRRAARRTPGSGSGSGRWRLPVALALPGCWRRWPSSSPPRGPARRRRRTGARSLAVTAITAGVDPVGGAVHCPQATVTLRATLATNGAPGTISYEWVRPDGRRTGGGQVGGPGRPARGDGHPGRRLRRQRAGARVGALHVISPASVYSEPLAVTYTCP